MRSRYYITLFLAGLIPLVGLTLFAAWLFVSEKPAAGPAAPMVDSRALQTTIPALQTNISSVASTLKAAIEGTYRALPGLVANHSDTDLGNFQKSHPGLAGVVVFSTDGRVQKMVPATAQLADQAYGSSPEFKQLSAKLEGNGGKVDLFYTTRLNYPSFVFSIMLDGKTFVQAVLNLAYFFPATDPMKGEMMFMDGESGQILYDSNPSKNQTVFNPNNQDPWLQKIQDSIKGKMTGNDLNPPNSAAVYAAVGIKTFGLVHIVPFSLLQPPSPTAEAPSPHKGGAEGVVEFFMTNTGRLMIFALVACMGLMLLIGSIGLGPIMSPLRKAAGVVLNAAQGSGQLSPQVVQSFGKDDIGQMVQAASMLMQKSEEDRQKANQEKEEAIRRARGEADAKSREAANQVAAAQQAANAAKNEAGDKNQQLNDKLKELDAMKSMAEGLRNQTEQAKAEIGKLKTQVGTAEQAKDDTQKKLTQVQTQLEAQLKDMEAKLLTTVAASSAINVSQVRAAAIRTMAEELKTTLGIIKGYVSSALGTAQGGINEKQQEFLGMVINRSARLEKFINDLLDIYQVEIEQANAPHEEVNLASEIEGLAFNFQAQADVKNIKLKVETKGTAPKVPIVRRRFNQLWNILYLQIIKDAPRASAITIGVEPIGENVKVTVQDPGLTVVAESLPKLFDEFYDPKHPASPQLAGTGLKFALVKTILAAHGGGAVAEKGDPGTRLILTFPTKVKKPGEGPTIALKPAAAAAVVAPAAPAVPKPPVTGTTPGVMPPKPPPPAIGIPKPAVPGTPAAPTSAAPGAPKSPAAGFLDSLISKTQPVNVPSAAPKPAVPGIPAAPVAPKPVTPGGPSIPAAPPTSGVTAPKPGGGLLDSLLDKKAPAPGAPATPAAPGAIKPPMPAAPAAIPPPALKPPVPGAPAPGAAIPPPAIKPPMPASPLAGGPASPAPGAPSAGAPAAPKVVPTNVKPTTPPPGILDMESADGVKLSAPPPKPAVPPAGMPPAGAPRPAMPGAPGAPMPPAGAPKPPMPGVPPGGLDASKAQKPKDGEGELIE